MIPTAVDIAKKNAEEVKEWEDMAGPVVVRKATPEEIEQKLHKDRRPNSPFPLTPYKFTGTVES